MTTKKMNLRKFSRNGKRGKVRRAAWKNGFFLELKTKPNGRIDTEATAVFPAGDLNPEPTRCRMPIDPEKLEADDWEEVED